MHNVCVLPNVHSFSVVFHSLSVYIFFLFSMYMWPSKHNREVLHSLSYIGQSWFLLYDTFPLDSLIFLSTLYCDFILHIILSLVYGITEDCLALTFSDKMIIQRRVELYQLYITKTFRKEVEVHLTSWSVQVFGILFPFNKKCKN